MSIHQQVPCERERVARRKRKSGVLLAGRERQRDADPVSWPEILAKEVIENFGIELFGVQFCFLFFLSFFLFSSRNRLLRDCVLNTFTKRLFEPQAEN